MYIQIEDDSSDVDIAVPTDKNYAYFLPVEVIVHLMGFLPYADRVAASQVCRHWYEASLHPKFINCEKIVVKRFPDAFSVFKNSSRPYFHLTLIEIEVNDKLREFWQKIAPNLKSLCFDSCNMNNRMFTEILFGCVNLETLVLQNCRELFKSSRLLESSDDTISISRTLSHLKELNLNYNYYLSDALLNRLMVAMPCLDSISLEGCRILFHAGLFEKYYPEKLTVDNEDASERALTFWHFYNSIMKRVNVIKKLNLSKTLVDSSALSLLSELNKLQLEELYIVNCERLTSGAIRSLSNHQKSITVLDLSYCLRINDQSLLYICSGLIKLKKLALRNCQAVTDLGITQLKNLEDLEELDISECKRVTNKGIKEGLCSEINRKFKKLFMENLNNITSGVVILMAKNLPELTHLNLRYCFNAVTDDSVQAIFQHQVKLQSLRLASCNSLTDAGLTGMGVGACEESAEPTTVQEASENIVISQPNLHISHCSKAEDEIIRDAYRKKAVQEMCKAQLLQSSKGGYSLVRLNGLQELELRCCNKITDVSLKYSFRFLELQHVNLSQCQQITHIGLKSIAESNPSIDTLNLSDCYNITDEGIVAITEGLRRLKYLDIKGCNQLTDASVSAIVEHCCQLRYLDLPECIKISDKAIDLQCKLPLQVVKLMEAFRKL